MMSQKKTKKKIRKENIVSICKSFAVTSFSGYHWVAPLQMCSPWSQLLGFQAADWKHSSTCPAVCIPHLLVPTEINECTLAGQVLPPAPQSVDAACLCGTLVKCMKCLSCHCFLGDGEGQNVLWLRAVQDGKTRMVGWHPWTAGAQTLQAWASSFPPHTFACFLCELGRSDQLILLTKGVN